MTTTPRAKGDDAGTPEQFSGEAPMPTPVVRPVYEPDFSEAPTTSAGLFAAALRGTPPPPELGAEIELTAEQKLRAKRKGKPRPKGTALERRELTGKIVAARIKGTPVQHIAEELGISRNTVREHTDRWLAEMEPTDSQTEDLRKVMNERLEALHERYWVKATGILNRDGTWKREPDVKAGEFLLRIYDRKARVMGLDLQPNTVNIAVSAESIAKYLGWDDDPEGGTGVIDVTPRLMPAGGIEDTPLPEREEDE